ncbi:hypothetical protein F5Y11DRAFT_414 [Daldinia sp. FL1419]|nr:hypothetical protein F5Y11DRAFT_414 [Daldinia sp. FL1419]
MCQYVFVTYRCAHTQLLAGPNCTVVLQQLSRIHQPEAWTPEGLKDLPFEWPDTCLPGDHNVVLVPSDKWCGWECKNTFSPTQYTSGLFTPPGSSCTPSINGMAIARQPDTPGSGFLGTPFEYKAPSYYTNNGYPVNWYNDSTPFPNSQAVGTFPGTATYTEAMNELIRASAESEITKITDGAGATMDVALTTEGLETNMVGTTGMLGMPGAQYGAPRKGVGWRNEKDEVQSSGDWWKDGDVFD